jgi:hypothetical protein
MLMIHADADEHCSSETDDSGDDDGRTGFAWALLGCDVSCSQQAELIASKIAFAQAIAPRAPAVPVEYPLSTLGQRALEYRCESPQSGTTEDRIRRDNRTALTLVFPSACDPPPAPLGTAAVLIASPEACHLQSEGERLELSKMLTNSKALGEKLRQDMAKLEVRKPSLQSSRV